MISKGYMKEKLGALLVHLRILGSLDTSPKDGLQPYVE